MVTDKGTLAINPDVYSSYAANAQVSWPTGIKKDAVTFVLATTGTIGNVMGYPFLVADPPEPKCATADYRC